LSENDDDDNKNNNNNKTIFVCKGYIIKTCKETEDNLTLFEPWK
jgi:hypothetical protein